MIPPESRLQVPVDLDTLVCFITICFTICLSKVKHEDSSHLFGAGSLLKKGATLFYLSEGKAEESTKMIGFTVCPVVQTWTTGHPICFTICLFISPDFDGHRAFKNGSLTLRGPENCKVPNPKYEAKHGPRYGWLIGWLVQSLLSYAGGGFHKDGASTP
jgi:hypothetical protein